LPVAVDRLFDYWLPEGIGVGPGSVVRVVLGRRQLLGVAVEIVRSTELLPEQILPIKEVITELPPIPEDVCSLAKFVAAYYQQSIGPCFADILPPIGSGSRGSATNKAIRASSERVCKRACLMLPRSLLGQYRGRYADG